MIEITSPGPLTLVEDLGRAGLASLGVTRSGAADRSSFRLANRLVGNDEEAAAFEVTLGGFRARFDTRATVAVTGAECSIHVDAVAVGMNGPVSIHRGGTLTLGMPVRGLRTYVAVRGGVDVAPVLGSRSTDVLSGLGPPTVTAGDTFVVGGSCGAYPAVDLAPVAAIAAAPTLELLPTAGRYDWFPPAEVELLGSQEYVVTQDSNRVALRLKGRPLHRAMHSELPPQGLVPGAVQIPPDGQPVVFLVDHPVTGGYPVVGVLTSRSIQAAAQSRPGEAVRLRMLPLPRDGAGEPVRAPRGFATGRT